ncbi:HAD family hydrolase [Xanthobacter wiegelii]|uniref:HAD family hydrolase n=1 Tax=Xanthobacter wiegelii TaxID=3119913 RepID=UPI00372C009B
MKTQIAATPSGANPRSGTPAGRQGNARPKIIGIVFDFDGVIVQSAELKVQAFAELYKDESPARIEEILAYQRLHTGVSRREKFQHFERNLLSRECDAARVDALSSAFSALVLEAVITCPFVPGAIEFLTRAKGHLPMHLVSGTPEDELLNIVALRSLDRFFDTVTGAPTTKSEAFRRIVAASGQPGAAWLAVGDSVTELHASHDTGMHFIGIAPHGEIPFPPDVPCLPSLVGLDALIDTNWMPGRPEPSTDGP